MADPWTQTLELTWRPALTFYEERMAILRCLDDRKVLRAFKVDPNRIDARLIKPGHELQVRHNGLVLELLGQDADLELAWACVVAALDLIKPTNTTVSARYQHIIELDGPFDQTVRVARDRVLSMPDQPEIEDWAVLMTFTGPSTVEFGVIRDDEAIPRLTRSVGRMQGRDHQQTEYWYGLDVKFPEVGLFADSRLAGPQIKGGPDEIRNWWLSARDRAGNFADTLHEKVSSDGTRRGMVSS